MKPRISRKSWKRQEPAWKLSKVAVVGSVQWYSLIAEINHQSL